MRRFGAWGSAQRCMPVPEWPAQDQRLRAAALAGGDIIDEEGNLAGQRPASIIFLDRGYGRWLTWLDHGGELDPVASPAARLTPERGRRFIRDLARVNSTKTIMGRLAALYYMVGAMEPGHDLRWLRRFIARVRARHRPVRDKRSRIVGVDELYRLGLSLMETASQRRKPRLRLSQFRNGLLVAMLAAYPARSDEMRTLPLSEVFLDRGVWWLRFSGDVNKTSAAATVPLPLELNGYIEEYLARCRPMLIERRKASRPEADAAFWISNQGRPLACLYQPVTKVTREAFGKPVNPHLFRDCAATSIAIHLPKEVRITPAVLNHTGQRTAEQVYNQAGNYEAASLWQAHLMQLRDRAKSPPGNMAQPPN